MKELYSIGDTAKLMGISVQTLRNYSNLNLLNPEYIDPDTGYRYFSFKQFHYIDRIKYLRNLGLPLSEIEDILTDKKADKIISCLEVQKNRVEEEMKKIKETYEEIKWYIDYFKYSNKYPFGNMPYILRFEKRYIMYVDYLERDSVESVETRLAKIKNNENLKYRRQYGFIANFQELIKKNFKPQKYFIYLREKPEEYDEEWLMELPAGEYLCFRAQICTDNWDPSIIAEYFKKTKAPTYVIANEYEDNLSEYHYCPYEVQSLICEIEE